jgi:hypothetical protein
MPRRPKRPLAPTPPAPEALSANRGLIGHLAWSTIVLVGAGLLISIELAAPCPPGGPLAFGQCEEIRPLAVAVVGLSAVLYVTLLSGVRAWSAGLRRRGLTDGVAARDWYLLAAAIGLVVAPLLAFTIVSAVR